MVYKFYRSKKDSHPIQKKIKAFLLIDHVSSNLNLNLKQLKDELCINKNKNITCQSLRDMAKVVLWGKNIFINQITWRSQKDEASRRDWPRRSLPTHGGNLSLGMRNAVLLLPGWAMPGGAARVLNTETPGWGGIEPEAHRRTDSEGSMSETSEMQLITTPAMKIHKVSVWRLSDQSGREKNYWPGSSWQRVRKLWKGSSLRSIALLLQRNRQLSNKTPTLPSTKHEKLWAWVGPIPKSGPFYQVPAGPLEIFWNTLRLLPIWRHKISRLTWIQILFYLQWLH